jgi:hypothetical protein
MKPVAYAGAHAALKEPLSFEAFLQQYDDAHAEWVNGEVIPKMPASVVHQRSSRFLYTLINTWVEYHQLGEVHHPPLLVKLPLPDNREVARGSEGVYRSRVLEGFWLQVEWLWTRPPLREVLKRLGLA